MPAAGDDGWLGAGRRMAGTGAENTATFPTYVGAVGDGVVLGRVADDVKQQLCSLHPRIARAWWMPRVSHVSSSAALVLKSRPGFRHRPRTLPWRPELIFEVAFANLLVVGKDGTVWGCGAGSAARLGTVEWKNLEKVVGEAQPWERRWG